MGILVLLPHPRLVLGREPTVDGDGIHYRGLLVCSQLGRVSQLDEEWSRLLFVQVRYKNFEY